MDREELLLTGLLLLVILIGLGAKQLDRGPQIEPVVIEATRDTEALSVATGSAFASTASVTSASAFEAVHLGGRESKQLLDINQATAVELQSVSGIGPNLSQQIINYRKTHGPFQTMDGLLHVSGIGPSRLQGLKKAFSVRNAAIPPETPSLPILAAFAPLGAPAQTEPMDLNQASPHELESLPGLGPALAQRIIDYRRQHGPFARAEQVMEVPGIGPKRYEQIAERTCVGPAAGSSESETAIEPFPQHATSGSTPPVETARIGAETQGKIDLNRATQEQLESLPGVGPVLAERIIQYRQLHDGFQSPEEVKNVSGIGEKKYAQIRPLIETPW